MNIFVPFFSDVIFKGLTIFYGSLSRSSNNHCLGLSAQFTHNCCAEVLNDDLNALSNISLMQFYESGNLTLGRVGLTTRILLNFFVDPIKRRILCIVLQHIQNETFFDGLLHGVDMEGLSLPLGIQSAKQLNGCRFRGGSKSKHGHICLLAIAPDLIGDHVFYITFCLFAGTKGHSYCQPYLYRLWKNELRQ